jgi:hypothetical protein
LICDAGRTGILSTKLTVEESRKVDVEAFRLMNFTVEPFKLKQENFATTIAAGVIILDAF